MKLHHLAVIGLMLLSAVGYADNPTIVLPEVEGKAVLSAETGFKLGENTSISGFQLQHELSNTLGETISKTPGVHNSSFGPGSGLPVIRSLSGSRVSILNNELDVSDMASISGNMPTAVEPFFADSITIEKNSSAVLYGSHAIGGSVDVKDSRIPRELPFNMLDPDKKFKGAIDLHGGYNTEQAQLFRFDGQIGKHIAYHIDASHNHVSSVRIPKSNKPSLCSDPNTIYTSGAFAGVDSRLAALCQVDAEIDTKINPAYFQYVQDDGNYTNNINSIYCSFVGSCKPNPVYVPGSEYYIIKKGPIKDITPTTRKRLPNSHQTKKQVSAGISYIGGQGYVGIGVNRYLNDYGVPGYSSQGTGTGYDNYLSPVNVKSSQTRWALDSEYRPQTGPIETLKFSGAYTDNHNGEYLGDVLSNTLDSRSTQFRFTAQHRPWHRLSGTAGVDWKQRQITATGADRYMPNVKTREYGFFVLENLDLNPVSAEVGLRLGQVKHQVDKSFKPAYLPDRDFIDRTFSLTQKHAALQWQALPSLKLRWQYSVSQHAPEANALYAGNLHFSALRLEQGTAALMQKEIIRGHNISLDWRYRQFGAHLAWYQTKLHNFTFANQTGAARPGGVPWLQWKQDSQKIQGIELEGNYSWQQADNQFNMRLFADIVKSRPTGDERRKRFEGNYLPGLPTNRYGIGFEWQNPQWQFAASLTRYTAQKHRGKYFSGDSTEPAMPGYTLLDAYVGYRQKWHKYAIDWYLDGRNLTNAEARPYNSPIKYLAPLAGRSVMAGVRVNF